MRLLDQAIDDKNSRLLFGIGQADHLQLEIEQFSVVTLRNWLDAGWLMKCGAPSGTARMPVAGATGKPACGKRVPMFGAWQRCAVCCCMDDGGWARGVVDEVAKTGVVVPVFIHDLLVEVENCPWAGCRRMKPGRDLSAWRTEKIQIRARLGDDRC